MMNFALIGATGHPDRFIKVIEEYPDCRVCAILNEDDASWQDVVSDENIDGVLVLSPLLLHYKQIKFAADHGKHIFVEKPAFATEEEGMEIRKIVEDKGLSFVISDPIRTVMRQLKAAKEIIRRGTIGNVTMIRVRCAVANALQSDHLELFDVSKTGGGIMSDLGCHAAHMLYVLAGLPSAVHAAFSTSSPAGREYGVEDNVIATFEYDNGILASVETSALAQKREDFFLVSGTNGNICCLDKELRVRTDEQWTVIPENDWPEHDIYPLNLWIDSIKDGRKIEGCGIIEALDLTRMIEGTYKAHTEKVLL